MGWEATTLKRSPGTLSTGAPKVMPERSTIGESVETAAAISPTESEIAAVAYRLWLANGCPDGSDQENWFRAEAILKSALVEKCQDLSRRFSTPRRDTRTEFGVLAQFRWRGHWEAWEMEWGEARWVWD
jgi:hypothetical protein